MAVVLREESNWSEPFREHEGSRFVHNEVLFPVVLNSQLFLLFMSSFVIPQVFLYWGGPCTWWLRNILQYEF